jgi:RecJ-like exonuclease
MRFKYEIEISLDEAIINVDGFPCDEVFEHFKSGYVDCPECDGKGQYWEQESCGKSSSNCCGGCGYDVNCDVCYGIGTLEIKEIVFNFDCEEDYNDIYL